MAAPTTGADSLAKIAKDNEALIHHLQAEFKEMMLLSTLADKRRQTDDVQKAAGQPGSPATLPFSGFIQAVSPPSAFVDLSASSHSSPLRRISMNFAASQVQPSSTAAVSPSRQADKVWLCLLPSRPLRLTHSLSSSFIFSPSADGHRGHHFAYSECSAASCERQLYLFIRGAAWPSSALGDDCDGGDSRNRDRQGRGG